MGINGKISKKKRYQHNLLIACDLLVEQMGVEPTTYTMRKKKNKLKKPKMWGKVRVTCYIIKITKNNTNY
jgi:hypothetical protein